MQPTQQQPEHTACLTECTPLPQTLRRTLPNMRAAAAEVEAVVREEMEEEGQAGSSSGSGKKAAALAAERASGGGGPAPASQTCSSCGAEAGPERSLLRCSRCQVVWYCNAQCQKDHWKAHKEICKRVAPKQQV